MAGEVRGLKYSEGTVDSGMRRWGSSGVTAGDEGGEVHLVGSAMTTPVLG